MRTGIRKVPIFQIIIIVILDWFSMQILWEWPKSVEVNFITKSGGKCIHEETSAGSFNVDLVCQPIAAKKEKVH